MARLFQERQKAMEQNPLYQLSVRVRNQLQDWIPAKVLENMANAGMSPMQFSFYLVFETAAQWVRENLQSETKTIYESVKDTYDFSPGASGKEKSEPLKDTLWDFCLRKDFLMAEIRRNHIPWDADKTGWMQKRENAYRLTPLQLQQLYDKESFCIKRVNELRRFRNPKHAPIDDIIAYYKKLMTHAEMCRNECEAKKRVISAINLNDFENKNISLFLYRTARYCAELGVKEITSDIEWNLLALTAIVSCGEGYTVTHKPVLFMQSYIPAAIYGDVPIIDLYVYLELEGLRIRKEVLYNWLDATRFTYQDIDDFICKWSCYDVFQIYSEIDLEVTKQTKKAIAILRDLIDRLTVDPLST